MFRARNLIWCDSRTPNNDRISELQKKNSFSCSLFTLSYVVSLLFKCHMRLQLFFGPSLILAFAENWACAWLSWGTGHWSPRAWRPMLITGSVQSISDYGSSGWVAVQGTPREELGVVLREPFPPGWVYGRNDLPAA